MTTATLVDTWAGADAPRALLGDRPAAAPATGDRARPAMFGHGSDAAVALLGPAPPRCSRRRAGPARCPEEAGLPSRRARQDDRAAVPRARGATPRPDACAASTPTLWRSGCGDAGRRTGRAPPEHLVALMDPDALGPRRSRPRWSSTRPVRWRGGCRAAPPGLGWGDRTAPRSPLEAWERGDPAERVAALARLRSHDPAAARDLLAHGPARGAGRAARRRATAPSPTGLGREDESLPRASLETSRLRFASGRRHSWPPYRRRPGPSGWPGRRAAMVRRSVAAWARPASTITTRRAPSHPSWARTASTPAAPPGTSLGVHVLRQVVAAYALGWWEEQAAARAPRRSCSRPSTSWDPVLLDGWSTAAVRQRDAALGPPPDRWETA
jgi:hypothetical protein